jgi:hypothetical protein
LTTMTVENEQGIVDSDRESEHHREGWRCRVHLNDR